MLKIAMGLMLGLLGAEALFHLRDEGAFAHLNIYEADAQLGARLEANAHTQISFGGNPVTRVETNADGLRGAPLPAQADILIVGDSQVFGLGVDEGDTFSARLAELTKSKVVNAGVPTYGPSEYTEMVARLAPRIKPRVVVYVVNLANDLFELERSNAERHAVWDGWAVRKEAAPATTVQFPGRRWLMSKSHLVYAVRSFFARANSETEFASEGTWKDIAATKTPASIPTASDRIKERLALSRELGTLNGRITLTVTSRVYREPTYAETVKEITHYDGDVRDIVSNPYAEASRPVDHTAEQLVRAAIGMEKNSAALRKTAEAKGDKELITLLDKRQELRGKLAILNAQNAADEPDSPLAAALQRAQRTANDAGAQLLVVALPLDVQVSETEWAKYKRTPIDMRPSEALAPWVVQAAEHMGARGLDATKALRDAEPGAFLNADLHMSAKGHLALAKAIAARLAEPTRQSPFTLPSGRSWPPTIDEWAAEAEVQVKGSTAAHCETKVVREWFRIRCFPHEPLDAFDDDLPGAPSGATAPTGFLGPAPAVQLVSGGAGDAFAYSAFGETVLITPLVDDVQARFFWNDHTRVLTLSKAVMGFGDKEPGKRPTEAIRPAGINTTPAVARALTDPTREPQCASNEIAFGATRRCVRDCTSSNLCPAPARCVPWQMLYGCVSP